MAVSALFGGRDIRPMHDQLRRFAGQFGVTMHLADHLPNTRRALALAEVARDQGRLDALRDAAMDAHWRDGRDIEDTAVLADLAASAGLTADAITAMDSPPMVARVAAMGREAQRWGVTGIPTYFLLPDGWEPGVEATKDSPRPVKIVGCQPYETVLAGCMRAGIARR